MSEVRAPDDLTIPNPWSTLAAHTPARIALGRAGISLPTSVMLDFQQAHALARDAVHHTLDVPALAEVVHTLGLHTVPLQSAAASREMYLRRPDAGRQLNATSRARLEADRAAMDAVTHRSADNQPRCSIAFVIADGLSALAVQRHAAPVLRATLARLHRPADARQPHDVAEWTVTPVAIVEQARVAVGDDIGAALGAQVVVVLIGERPGLSAPDSLGAYLTWAPTPGRVDADRNCISNIRPDGLSYDDAADALVYLLEHARQRQQSGVMLKDDRDTPRTLPSG